MKIEFTCFRVRVFRCTENERDPFVRTQIRIVFHLIGNPYGITAEVFPTVLHCALIGYCEVPFFVISGSSFRGISFRQVEIHGIIIQNKTFHPVGTEQNLLNSATVDADLLCFPVRPDHGIFQQQPAFEDIVFLLESGERYFTSADRDTGILFRCSADFRHIHAIVQGRRCFHGFSIQAELCIF